MRNPSNMYHLVHNSGGGDAAFSRVRPSVRGRKAASPSLIAGWERKSFYECFSTLSTRGHQIQTKEYLQSGRYPVVDQGEARFVGFSNDETKVLRCPMGGVIVFGDHTRNVKFINEDFIIGADGTKLLVAKTGSTEFLFNLLSGVRIPNTGYNRHFKFLQCLSFLLPPLSEQDRIVSILSAADRVIVGKERLLEAKKTRKRALMQKLLNPGTNGDSAFSRVGAGGTRKKGRISHVESVKMIIPVNEWEWKRLEEIATITSGSTPSRQHPEYWNGGIPWVTTGELATSPILKTVETISEVGREKASLRKYAKGTLLMAMYGQGKTRGTVSILGIDATINQACAAISTQSNDTMFLFYQLQYRYESIRRLSNVGNQENLNAEIIASISIPLPSLETQRRIAAILAAADREIDGLVREIDAWKEKRKALSQLLLSGKVRV